LELHRSSVTGERLSAAWSVVDGLAGAVAQLVDAHVLLHALHRHSSRATSRLITRSRRTRPGAAPAGSHAPRGGCWRERWRQAAGSDADGHWQRSSRQPPRRSMTLAGVRRSRHPATQVWPAGHAEPEVQRQLGGDPQVQGSASLPVRSGSAAERAAPPSQIAHGMCGSPDRRPARSSRPFARMGGTPNCRCGRGTDLTCEAVRDGSNAGRTVRLR
jgi:hypothetical protein